VPAKPTPRLGLRGRVDVHHLDVPQPGKAVEEPHRYGVPGAAAQQRPGLTE
jgi:hypothetical protein